MTPKQANVERIKQRLSWHDLNVITGRKVQSMADEADLTFQQMRDVLALWDGQQEDEVQMTEAETKSWQAARVGRSTGSGVGSRPMLAHFIVKGERRCIRLSAWRRCTRRGKTPHGKKDGT
jgi:deferrochelatase/peroxidase EfeB